MSSLGFVELCQSAATELAQLSIALAFEALVEGKQNLLGLVVPTEPYERFGMTQRREFCVNQTMIGRCGDLSSQLRAHIRGFFESVLPLQ